MPLRAGLMAVGALLVAVCQLGCFSGVEGPDPDAQGSELQLSGDLVYTLDWDRTGVVFGEGSWSASNELGFEFEIDQAYAVTYSLELVPCDPYRIWMQELVTWRPGCWNGLDPVVRMQGIAARRSIRLV